MTMPALYRYTVKYTYSYVYYTFFVFSFEIRTFNLFALLIIELSKEKDTNVRLCFVSQIEFCQIVNLFVRKKV